MDHRCQVHLGKVVATPLCRGKGGPDGTAQWGLGPFFTGHLLLFDRIRLPIIGFHLPLFISPSRMRCWST